MSDDKDLDDLIKRLEKIRYEGHGEISFTKAIYLLANEIKELKDRPYLTFKPME